MRRSLLLIVLFVICAGCGNTAARQQKAEEVRKQQVVNDLKETAEAMHNSQGDESAAE